MLLELCCGGVGEGYCEWNGVVVGFLVLVVLMCVLWHGGAQKIV